MSERFNGERKDETGLIPWDGQCPFCCKPLTEHEIIGQVKWGNRHTQTRFHCPLPLKRRPGREFALFMEPREEKQLREG